MSMMKHQPSCIQYYRCIRTSYLRWLAWNFDIHLDWLSRLGAIHMAVNMLRLMGNGVKIIIRIYLISGYWVHTKTQMQAPIQKWYNFDLIWEIHRFLKYIHLIYVFDERCTLVHLTFWELWIFLRMHDGWGCEALFTYYSQFLLNDMIVGIFQNWAIDTAI